MLFSPSPFSEFGAGEGKAGLKKKCSEGKETDNERREEKRGLPDRRGKGEWPCSICGGGGGKGRLREGEEEKEVSSSSPFLPPPPFHALSPIPGFLIPH